MILEDVDQNASCLALQYQIRVMNIWDVVLPIVLFLGGLWVVQLLPCYQDDELMLLNQRSAQVLSRLVQTKYFRIIRLNVNEECQLGRMKKICQSKSCSVCRCGQDDIPEFWINTQKVKSHLHDQDMWADERQNWAGWVWHVEDEANDRGEYFDIHTNIQSFTNYNGSYIWRLIYEENCFPGNYFLCAEEQVLYNIISGLHTSISTHLSQFYKNSSEQSIWADLRANDNETKFHFNQRQYQRRVLDHPQRINNLMFLYRLLAKAIGKAAPYLHSNFTIQSDNFAQDIQSKKYLDQLLPQIEGYDLSSEEMDSLRFFTQDNPKIKQYQKYIHNISDILNCVECEKCRLFGKMQTYGVGTALKILLGYPTPYKRNQIVALFNAFNKISKAVNTFYKLGYYRPRYTDIYKFVGGLFAILYVWRRFTSSFIDVKELNRDDKNE